MIEKARVEIKADAEKARAGLKGRYRQVLRRNCQKAGEGMRKMNEKESEVKTFTKLILAIFRL